MDIKTESRHAGDFLISEANGTRSREEVTVVSGAGVLVAGTVLGKITKGAASAAAVAGNTGDGTMGAITVGGGAKVGTYRVTFIEPATNLGAFVVEDPDGINVGSGDVASAFSGGGLGFTISDGATDFAAGDQFVITVAAGSGKYKAYNDANTDGSEVAAAILYAGMDATAADAAAVVIARDAEVVNAYLTGIDAAGSADLAARGIIVR